MAKGGRSKEQQFNFWPWLKSQDCQGAEPDVLIALTDESGTNHRVLVEAKYLSGKSSQADYECAVPTDQLAREWDNIVCFCKPNGYVPHLVYITADFGIPQDDIDDAAKEFQKKRPHMASRHPLNCHWLSWRHIPIAFKGTTEPILQDLLKLTSRYGLVFYSGITPIAEMTAPPWKFSHAISNYSFWPADLTCPTWSFKQ